MIKSTNRGISQVCLEHYDFLKQIGVWDLLTDLEIDIHDYDHLFSEILEMLSHQSALDLINFVLTCFLNKFVPQKLLFAIEEPPEGILKIYYYENLKPVAHVQDVIWYKSLKAKFSKDPRPLNAESVEKHFSKNLGEYVPDFVLPLRGIGGVYGMILFGKKVIGDTYSDREKNYIQKLMFFFSVCLQNTLHHQTSITDAKTGLFNYPYFMKRLEEETLRAHRQHTGTALLLMDIDFFKNLNDSAGHLAGDAVLAELGRTLKSLLRAEDILARFGGEEFILLIPNCSENSLIEISERLRKTVENMVTVFEGRELQITISLGATYAEAGIPVKPRNMILEADAALYRSKAEGRNRTTLYSPEEFSQEFLRQKD